MTAATTTSNYIYYNVKFLGGKYLGDSEYNTCYQICDYCRQYKKMHILNYSVYYRKGARRRLVSFCRYCGTNITAGDLHVVDYKYGGYFEILDAVKNNGQATAISFEDAVKKAYYNLNGGMFKQSPMIIIDILLSSFLN